MRSDRLYLEDIVEAAGLAERYFHRMIERDDTDDEDLYLSAILQKLMIIGEAAARMSAESRSRFPEVDWRRIADFRNYAIHQYVSIDWDVVRQAA